MKAPTRPKSEILFLSTVDQGRQLLVNSVFDGVSQDLLTIVADETDESLWVQLVIDGDTIEIPLKLVKDAVDCAPGNVHSEAWFREHHPEAYEPGLSAAARASAKRQKDPSK